MGVKERFRGMSRREFLKTMGIVGAGAFVAACENAGVLPRLTPTIPNPVEGSPTSPDPTAIKAEATQASTQVETATDQPTNQPDQEPTKKPEPSETATKTPMETFGPVEVTGEEYKLLHTQNVVAFKEKDPEGNNVWEMIPPETYAARNETVLAIRQRTMDKLAAETGVAVPENNFTAYLTWLHKLKDSGKVDDTKLWEYASNMPITNEEIRALVENRIPENKRLAYPNNLEPGLNYDESDKVYSVRLPDGTTVENKVPTRFMGKVLAVVPRGLLPGESVKIPGKVYVVLGDDNNRPFTIIALGTSGHSYGKKNISDYFNYGKDVVKMPPEWMGYYIPNYTGAAGPLYHKETFAKLGETEYQGGQTINSLLLIPDTWLRGFRLFWPTVGLQFHLDPNGVAMPVQDTVGYAQK